MIDKIEQEGRIDIYDFVLQMRRERSLMVQTVVCLNILIEKRFLFCFYIETICIYISIIT
jgi:hypothetical protein